MRIVNGLTRDVKRTQPDPGLIGERARIRGWSLKRLADHLDEVYPGVGLLTDADRRFSMTLEELAARGVRIEGLEVVA